MVLEGRRAEKWTDRSVSGVACPVGKVRTIAFSILWEVTTSAHDDRGVSIS